MPSLIRRIRSIAPDGTLNYRLSFGVPDPGGVLRKLQEVGDRQRLNLAWRLRGQHRRLENSPNALAETLRVRERQAVLERYLCELDRAILAADQHPQQFFEIFRALEEIGLDRAGPVLGARKHPPLEALRDPTANSPYQGKMKSLVSRMRHARLLRKLPRALRIVGRAEGSLRTNLMFSLGAAFVAGLGFLLLPGLAGALGLSLALGSAFLFVRSYWKFHSGRFPEDLVAEDFGISLPRIRHLAALAYQVQVEEKAAQLSRDSFPRSEMEVPPFLIEAARRARRSVVRFAARMILDEKNGSRISDAVWRSEGRQIYLEVKHAYHQLRVWRPIYGAHLQAARESFSRLIPGFPFVHQEFL